MDDVNIEPQQGGTGLDDGVNHQVLVVLGTLSGQSRDELNSVSTLGQVSGPMTGAIVTIQLHSNKNNNNGCIGENRETCA